MCSSDLDKTWFAYNEQEKTKILKELDGKKITIQRSKGLGENDPEMMWMTTMNPETRRLIKVSRRTRSARRIILTSCLVTDCRSGRISSRKTAQSIWNWRIFRKTRQTANSQTIFL